MPYTGIPSWVGSLFCRNITFDHAVLSIGWYYFHFIFQNGKTALQYAAHKGQLLAVKALIEAGADLDITDEVWGTFKMSASELYSTVK